MFQGMALILSMILVLYTLTGDDSLMIYVRGRWLLKLEMMYHGMMNRFLEFGEKNSILQSY